MHVTCGGAALSDTSSEGNSGELSHGGKTWSRNWFAGVWMSGDGITVEYASGMLRSGRSSMSSSGSMRTHRSDGRAAESRLIPNNTDRRRPIIPPYRRPPLSPTSCAVNRLRPSSKGHRAPGSLPPPKTLYDSLLISCPYGFNPSRKFPQRMEHCSWAEQSKMDFVLKR